MEYSFEVVTLENGINIFKPILPKEFEDYAVMLMTDVRWNDKLYTKAIESVLSGKSDEEMVSGDAGCLTIRKEKSSFYSFYDEDADECNIGTIVLQQLIIDWKKALFKAIQSGKLD